MAAGYNKKLRGWRFVLFNVCLALSHAMVLFNAGAYIAMLPRVAGGLAVPPSVAAWTQTDYMLGLALAFPMGGWLSRRLGEYRVFVASIVVFAFASAACWAASSFAYFLAARIVLGFSGGMSLPLGHSMLLKEYSARNKNTGIGVWSLVTLTPFTLGPSIGGWIADNLGWRWLFALNIPVALTIAGCVEALLYRRGHQKIHHRFDVVGMVLAFISLGSLQTLLNQGNDWDWSNSGYLMCLMIVAVIAFSLCVIWDLAAARPYLAVDLFKHRNFTIVVLILMIGFLFFQGLLSLLVVQLQLLLGYSSFLAGLVFVPMLIFAKPTAGVMHWLIRQFDARLLSSVNLFGFAVTYFWLSRFDNSDSFEQLFWPKLLEGFCLGSFFAPLTALLLHNISPERHWQAVELATSLRIAAGAIGISFQGIVFYFRSPYHLTRFAEIQTPFDDDFITVAGRLSGTGISEAVATHQIQKLAYLQSGIHALNDAFWLAGCVFTCLSVLVWHAYPIKSSTKATTAQSLRQRIIGLLAREL